MYNFNLPKEFDWVDASSPQFNNALNDILNTDKDLLIIGPGGTGKSLMLEIAYKILSTKKNIAVVCPTGIAASNLAINGIPAVTIHSLFRIPPGDLYERKIEAEQSRIDLIHNLDILIFDEISMVTPALFDQIGWLLTQMNSYPRVIMFGDVLQLPPVVRLGDNGPVDDYYSAIYNNATDFFASKWYNIRSNRITKIILNKIYRQKDTSFQNVLNRIRLGEQTKEDLDIINSRVCNPVEYIKSHDIMLYLASTNERVNELNDIYECKFNGKPYMTYVSRSEGTMKKPVEDKITIYVGEQVMCTANNKQGNYQNGTLGIVQLVSENLVVIKKLDGRIAYVTPNTWVDHKLNYDYRTHEVKIERPGSYTMIACHPAFASTIHKAQGLTLDNIYLDLVNWVPVSGVYLALSRCRTLEGLGMLRPITNDDIKLSKSAVEFYKSLLND